MPYKFQSDNLKIKKEDNRTRKLNDEQKKDIQEKYSTGIYSYRQLASEYSVCKRTIQFIIKPEKLENNKKLREGKSYYDKEKQREYMKNHRDYKKQLYNEGKLIK